MLVAFLVRALPVFEFLHRGVVAFAPADAMYHVRRAYYTFASWPSVLVRDAYVNYPDGAPVPWSPLPDIVAGTLARAFASGDAGFELAMAWWPPLVGALGALPVYFLARELAPRSVALGAVLFYALLPISVLYGRFANPDHHVAVAAVGACVLLACVRLARSDLDASPRQLARHALAPGVARAALLLTWHGSLLYLALAESALALVAVASARPMLFAAHAGSAAATLALVAPVVAALPEPLGGAYSSIALSRLHLLAIGAVGVATSAGWGFARRRPTAPALARMGVLAAAALAFVGVAALVPDVRAGLEPAFRFLSMTDAAGSRTAEQFPLFARGDRPSATAASLVWAGYAYLLPFVPIAFAIRARSRALPDRRAGAWMLAGWSAVFVALSISQRRYGNDLAAAASVGFALAGQQLAALLTRAGLARAAARAAAAAAGLALFAPAFTALYLPWVARGIERARAGEERIDPPRSATWGVTQFLAAVRRATPETRGYVDASSSPEYGIVAHANLGHAIQWVARRATPTDPFWEYIGPENWNRAFELLSTKDEELALALARTLRARYVVASRGLRRGGISERLFEDDGRARDGLPALAHFRLVTEGPVGGVGLQDMFGGHRSDDAIPYKLFEVVAGARVEVAARAGARVEIVADVASPSGREFRYVAAADADPAGTARLRFPYASEGVGGVRAHVRAPIRVRIDGDEVGELAVSERDVRRGAAVPFRPGT